MRKPSHTPTHAGVTGRADRRRRAAPRLSCPCCAPAEPDRLRPSVRLANWLARGSSNAVAAAAVPSDSAVSTVSPFEDL